VKENGTAPSAAWRGEDIIRSVMQALIVLDPKGVVSLVNDAACFLLGYREEDLVGSPVETIFSDGGPFRERREDGAVLHRYVSGKEIECRGKDGRLIPVLFSSSALLGEAGEINGIICAAHDISERKKVEKALEDARAHLFQASKMEMVGRLAAGAAHEVKNPLAVLMQGIQFLQGVQFPSGSFKEDPSDFKTVLTFMNDAVVRADTVIRGLLDFSGSSTMKMSAESLGELAGKSLVLVKNAADKKRIRLALEAPPDLPAVSIDRNKMEQVLINLIMNAVEAMPVEGEILVRVRAADRSGGRRLAVDVENTGAAIPENVLKNMFEPFFTTKRGSGGTGLGLSIVKSLVDQHKGSIEIANRAEGGVRATVEIPI
jgi:PAS domain S-box-containing protein